MHADYTYPCTPKLPPHLAQSFTNIYLVLNPPTIFTLHVITQPFYANLYMLCVHWWSTFRLCWFLVSSWMKTLNIKMPPGIHQSILPFKRRGWWQPIAQTTAPHDPPCYCVRPQMFPLLNQMLKRSHTAARTENSCGRDLQMGWEQLGQSRY